MSSAPDHIVVYVFAPTIAYMSPLKPLTHMKYFLAFSILSVLLAGCKHIFHIGEPLDGPGMVYTPPTNVPLEDVQREWPDGIITVDVPEGEEANVLTLLTAFNRTYPTHAIDTLLAKVSDPNFDGADIPDNSTGDIVQTLLARPNPYVQFYTETEGKEHMTACTMKRENGHTLLVIELMKNSLKRQKGIHFYCFFDYDPETSQLSPETEPWAKVSPVVEGNHLVPSLNLFNGLFAMGEYTAQDEGPIYCHFLEYDGQNIVYNGYEANLPEDEDGSQE